MMTTSQVAKSSVADSRPKDNRSTQKDISSCQGAPAAPSRPVTVEERIETGLDPAVRRTLNQIAETMRLRARERAQALSNEIQGFINGFVAGCPYLERERPNQFGHVTSGGCYSVYDGCGRPTDERRWWPREIEALCENLGRAVGEHDADRELALFSTKILELSSPETH